jgi:hypothetical protein
MRDKTVSRLLPLLAGLAALSALAARDRAAPDAAGYAWLTVVNINDVMPGTVTGTNPDGRTFNSFNQPSVNSQGLVVFRARSRGGQQAGPPTRGIYIRDMSEGDVPGETIEVILDLRSSLDTKVPDPNNLDASFTETPSFPRIARNENVLATRGNHTPVWLYALPDGTDTRAGTSGVYASLAAGEPSGAPVTGASKLGAVPGFEIFRVPGAPEGTYFDVFPGAPAVTNDAFIAFKGNYTLSEEGSLVSKTGVFYRSLTNAFAGGTLPTELVANSDTEIPNVPPPVRGLEFGSTAPPSAANGTMVFVGLDVEEDPHYGGIYRAALQQPPVLETLVGIGSRVPRTFGRFNRLGEGLAYDGRFVAFWGAWGAKTRTLWLDCPTEGNQPRTAFCLEEVGDNFPVEVPAQQGIFVLDTETGKRWMVARTGPMFSDFVYWNFSGRVPGDEEEEDGEPARWRAASFVALSALPDGRVAVAFKARRGRLDPVEHDYVDPRDGIYLREGPGNAPIQVVVDTNTPGPILDAEAPLGSFVTEMGIERDGFRDGWLAISAKMEVPVPPETEEGEEEEEGMSGIYLTRAPSGDGPPSITSPVPGASLTGSTELFRFTTNGATVNEWILYAGSRPGGKDYFESGSLGTVPFATVTGLPTDGSAVKVRLWYRTGAHWHRVDAQYVAAMP